MKYRRFMTNGRWQNMHIRPHNNIDSVKIGATNYRRKFGIGSYWFVVPLYFRETFMERRFKWQTDRQTFRSRLYHWRRQ